MASYLVTLNPYDYDRFIETRAVRLDERAMS